RVAGCGAIGATGQVAMNLTPYASYMITVCKTGLCKSIGLITISSSNIQLSVMPTVPSVSQPSLASATYDYTNKALRVNVSCASPPCTVRIFKSVTWYNSWQMRIPVSLSQGWNLVFLKKSNTVSASGMWAYINNTDWSEIRFGDSSGLPKNFLNYSIIWSNTTHAQVLVYAPQAGTYYLYWQPLEQVPYANVTNPFVQCISGRCGVYFDGVSRYGVAPLPSQLTGNPTFSLSLWSYQYLPPSGRSWELWFGYPSPLQAFHILLTSSSYHATGFWGATGLSTGVSYVIAPQNWENYVARYNSTNMYLEAYRNNVLAGSITFQITNTQYGTQPNIPSSGSAFYLAKKYDYYFFQGYISSVIVYNRYVSTSEISQLYQNPDSPPTSGIILWFKADPHYVYDRDWNGYVDWIDLSGNNNHATLYNFHSQGSFINAPQRQPYNILIITQTCNTQLCSYTVNSGDPYFTVIVSDSSGKMSQSNTGLSVPLWQSPLGSVVTTIGKTLNLDAWGVNINDLFIFLIGLAILYSAFTYRNWELGLIVFGVWLSIGTLLLGGSGRLMIPGLSLALFGAAISYMLKREQAP
ncbi:MAG: hypothetical protein JHC26_07705, partial [Thermofilum sp.]|uniref:LamG-like jellyroll fold domain-containing protein n=1 Tax=Thermofilum sp. TaxID=1961369 RepID=UPI00258D0D99